MAFTRLKIPLRIPASLALVAVLYMAPGQEARAQPLVPQVVVVQLGEHGGSITLSATSAGTYTFRGDPFASGETVVADNGNEYRLTLREGEWSAEFVPPPPAAVALGMSGLAVLVTRAEDRQYLANGRPIGPDGLFEAANGKSYRLTLGEDGWRSEFLPLTVHVRLGQYGGSLTLRQEEDGRYWMGDQVFETGRVVNGSNDYSYRVTLADGVWFAEYIPRAVWVSFGASRGGIVLLRREDGTYANGGRVVENGSQVTASDGTTVTLTMRNGVWEARPRSATVDPDLPDPDTGRTSDTLAAYEGVRPELVSDARGNPRRVLRVGDSEFSVSELFSRGEVTQSETFREMVRGEIRSLLAQMRLLIQIAESGGDDLTSAIEDKWDRSAEALEALFGGEAIGVLGRFPEDDGELDTAEAVAVLEDVIDALSSRSAFRRAVHNGVFRNSTNVSLNNADDVYGALRSFTRVRFGWSENTRFGAYLKRERADDVFDDLNLLDGDSGMGVFAYSPLETARTADLPIAGEATYSGTTLAVSGGDSPDFYSGNIELNARFSTRRVSALITDLERRDGTPWRYLLTAVESISLPSAQLGRVGTPATFQVSGDANIRFPLTPGGLSSRSLDSDFDGRFVGRGADAGDAVIGTWSLENSLGDNILTGAFGAEHQSTITRPRLQINDAGTVSKTFFGAEPDRNGDIVLGGDDEDGTRFDVSRLYTVGSARTSGDRLFTVVRREIARELNLLDVVVELDNDTLRQSLWTRVNDVLNRRIFAGGAEDPLGADYPTTRRRDPDDTEAEEVLREALEALSSVASFREALEEDGVFHSAREAASDPASMYAVRDHVLTVEYGDTEYTRFGAWTKLVGTAASTNMAVDTENPPDVFAYSPLEPTVYGVLDPTYPREFRASYIGRTVAVDASAAEPKLYEGSIDLSVEWSQNIRNTLIHSVILGLRTVADGQTFQHQGADVHAIFFSNVRMHSGFGEPLEFDDTRPEVRIRYENIRLGERTWVGNAFQNGAFVGKSLDGPLGVIGTWSLSDRALDIDLKGAYGADLTP